MLFEDPRLAGVEWTRPAPGQGYAWCVTFAIHSDTEFTIPIWLDSGTNEVDIIPLAKGKFHRLMSAIAERTRPLPDELEAGG